MSLPLSEAADLLPDRLNKPMAESECDGPLPALS